MYCTFNGTSSERYGLKVKNSNHLSRPAKKIESISVPGRTGNLIIDDGSKENLQIELECFVDARSNANLPFLTKQIGAWLQDPIGYQTLTMYDGTTFKAICTNQIDVSELIDNFAEISIRFDATEVTS